MLKVILPRLFNNWQADMLETPKVSTAIGWKIFCCYYHYYYCYYCYYWIQVDVCWSELGRGRGLWQGAGDPNWHPQLHLAVQRWAQAHWTRHRTSVSRHWQPSVPGDSVGTRSQVLALSSWRRFSHAAENGDTWSSARSMMWRWIVVEVDSNQRLGQPTFRSTNL